MCRLYFCRVIENSPSKDTIVYSNTAKMLVTSFAGEINNLVAPPITTTLTDDWYLIWAERRAAAEDTPDTPTARRHDGHAKTPHRRPPPKTGDW